MYPGKCTQRPFVEGIAAYLCIARQGIYGGITRTGVNIYYPSPAMEPMITERIFCGIASEERTTMKVPTSLASSNLEGLWMIFSPSRCIGFLISNYDSSEGKLTDRFLQSLEYIGFATPEEFLFPENIYHTTIPLDLAKLLPANLRLDS